MDDIIIYSFIYTKKQGQKALLFYRLKNYLAIFAKYSRVRTSCEV